MDPTQILRDEHVMIRAALRAFAALADKLERGGPFSEKLAAGALDFFANFADAHHHAKEERILFPALEPGRVCAPRRPRRCRWAAPLGPAPRARPRPPLRPPPPPPPDRLPPPPAPPRGGPPPPDHPFVGVPAPARRRSTQRRPGGGF